MRRHMKRFGIVGLASLASCLLPLASFAAGLGTTSASFLKIGLGARPAAMGFAFAAVADDLNAIQYNPAGLARLSGTNVSVTYLSYFQDITYGWLASSFPLELSGPGTLGISVGYLTLGGIERRELSDTDTPTSTFGSSDMNVALSYAFQNVMDGLHLGVNLKVISESIGDTRATGLATDLGLFWTVKEVDPNFTVSLALQNLGTGLKFVSVSDPFPTTIKAGAAYQLLEKTLTFAADLDYPLAEAQATLKVGMEYWLQGLIAPRIGYRMSPSNTLGAMAAFGTGLGLKLDTLTLDYAYLPQGDLGNTHRVSLGYRF